MNFSIMVFGPYIDFLDTVCLRSLFQSGNLPRLIKEGRRIQISLYTKADDENKLTSVIDKWKWDGVDFKILVCDSPNIHERLFKDCVDSNAPMMLICPDFFFANGSIYNMASIKYKGKMCIAAAHLRVDCEGFQRLLLETEGEISASKLVSMAMKTPHQCLTEAFINKDCNGSRHGGLAIQQIGEDALWSVTHQLPSAILVNMQPDDLLVLKDFGHYDHIWPTKLINEKRYKYVGSSDFFFAVELTSPENNRIKVLPGNLWNDECDQKSKHNIVNRNFLAVLRGENE